ncbi:hypothetical protein [Stygiolobus caldivivus]|uniref:Thermopsin n=1 Tax=Stygiolobus caldivivus TaxID=2824673 RepID=A0A8D5ZIR0_9CREN|nr:hypothetical protein [Stygiolobus caldivivus]BCU69497.1 hypothetical protein KN1_07940 [Stygiolobus caldivivus]
MKRYLLGLLVVLLLFPVITSAISSNVTPTNYYPSNNYATVQSNTVTIYKNLSYHVVTQTTLNKTKLTNYYYLNYEVIGNENSTLTVDLQGNFTTNSSKLIGGLGNHTANIFSNLLSLYYPFFPPFLEYNTTYGIETNSGKYAISYIGPSKFLLMGSNVTSQDYVVYFNSTYSQFFKVLSNGLVANTTYTLPNGTSLTITLSSYSEPMNITFNTPSLSGIDRPYLYLEFAYNPNINSLTPQYYVEIYYPFQIGDYLAQVNYLLYPQSGNIVVPANIGNIPVSVNFVLVFKPYYDEQLTFTDNVGNSSIIWDGDNFTFVNTTYVTTVNGTQVETYLYKHFVNGTLPQASYTIYTYFSHNGELELEKVYSVGLGNVTLEYSFVSNEYVSTNATYPPLTKPLYTTLPFKPIDLDTAILVTIIFSVILSAIIILLRQR